MKSYNTSFPQFRRALIAAAVVLATGTVAAVAQSSQQTTPSTPNSGSSYNTNNSNSANTSSNSTANDTDSSRATSDENSSSSNASGSMNSDNNTSSSSSSSKLSWSDKHFITKIAEGNQKEIQLAQLGAERASNPDVRQFAQQMIQDHQKMASDLQTIASNNSIKVKEEKGEDHEYKKLSKAQGAEFDRAFIKRMVAEHKKDVKEFSDRVDDSKNQEIKTFVQNQLPTLQHHLQMAQQLEQSIVPTGRSGKESWKGSSSSSDTSATGTSSTGTTQDSNYFNRTNTSGASSSMNHGDAGTNDSSGASTSASSSNTSSTK